ncbi:hypothetical protein K7X08_033234 [Anisodus acutangulus]|uniref:Glutaredoxin domain-containing protein n=1 Tax=Anisodus acutangulus TaxID=402998 RepID=A0A9Q1RD17_9SOLA|nr:hypothetical protein K7X08_033234 [Anisodus acutangulus]
MISSSAATSGGSTSRESQAPGESKNNNDTRMGVARLIAENAIVVVATHECSMCLVVKVLLRELGVNPTLYEVNEADKAIVLEELSRINEGGEGSEGGGGPKKLPAVYVGGKLLGGVKEVMNTHY